ncbi:MAG: class II D-tagatose-bisphosphate aldolase, non-catalytic subunit [Ignavibacteriales bacterium]|nr:class II D-tagatose-bisphosphate aldolase, non-catalytic subunit [Ignavibacteriales bacterium]
MITENKILWLIKEHKLGKKIGITSVCSANVYVLKAAIRNAQKKNQYLLIESTSNQVDQFGGYTGITPAVFRDIVFKLSKELKFPKEKIILGGDHLGPNRWQYEDSSSAMAKAKDQIAAYVRAGYQKLHLDTSMKCSDDGNKEQPLDASIIAERAAILCKVAEDASIGRAKTDLPVYIIGTDVPPPGGAKDEHYLHITTKEDVERTIELTKNAFEKYNLHDAWERVAAVVVQPGVEFGDESVFNYDRYKAKELSKLINRFDNLIYEAHSTDYQKKISLKHMVEDHFVILKVGPWLTYAMREAIFALALIEKELLSNRKDIQLSNLIDIVDQQMLNDQKYWVKYYIGSEDEIKIKRKYSYSDRIRYYWNYKIVNAALMKLIINLRDNKIPISLISQFMPQEYEAIVNGNITLDPQELINNKITHILEIYNYATNGGFR